uniref:Uncharacterized protein n=1 Tax=Diadromus pulchellus ascovirus 4a TaxID=158683 RepID=Q9DST4_9VIRU|nr:hypothetical protein [Diadromus pulchellus ascovirus 4a]
MRRPRRYFRSNFTFQINNFRGEVNINMVARLIHETTFENFVSILKSKMLYKPSENNLGNTVQGSRNRRIVSDPFISLKNKNFYDYYDEVDAVYMRLYDEDTFVMHDDVMFIFDPDSSIPV